jgi:hypothetical protein
MIRSIAIGVFAVLAVLPACSGGDGSDASSTGSEPEVTLDSCYVADDFVCQEQGGSPFGDCEAGGGVVGNGCPTTDLYGISRVAGPDTGSSIELNVYVYVGWESANTDPPEEECALLGGTWEPA